jgi:hypothetical protein
MQVVEGRFHQWLGGRLGGKATPRCRSPGMAADRSEATVVIINRSTRVYHIRDRVRPRGRVSDPVSADGSDRHPMNIEAHPIEIFSGMKSSPIVSSQNNEVLAVQPCCLPPLIFSPATEPNGQAQPSVYLCYIGNTVQLGRAGEIFHCSGSTDGGSAGPPVGAL